MEMEMKPEVEVEVAGQGPVIDAAGAWDDGQVVPESSE